MKLSLTVKFPIKQDLSGGMSWSQINELSWTEINLLSWHEISYLLIRYLAYSIQFAKTLFSRVSLTIKKVTKTRGSYVPK